MLIVRKQNDKSGFLKVEPSASKIEDELQVNADMIFDLIGNLGTLESLF